METVEWCFLANIFDTVSIGINEFCKSWILHVIVGQSSPKRHNIVKFNLKHIWSQIYGKKMLAAIF